MLLKRAGNVFVSSIEISYVSAVREVRAWVVVGLTASIVVAGSNFLDVIVLLSMVTVGVLQGYCLRVAVWVFGLPV